MALPVKRFFISRGASQRRYYQLEEFIMAKKVQAYVKLQVALVWLTRVRQ